MGKMPPLKVSNMDEQRMQKKNILDIENNNGANKMYQKPCF